MHTPAKPAHRREAPKARPRSVWHAKWRTRPGLPTSRRPRKSLRGTGFEPWCSESRARRPPPNAGPYFAGAADGADAGLAPLANRQRSSPISKNVDVDETHGLPSVSLVVDASLEGVSPDALRCAVVGALAELLRRGRRDRSRAAVELLARSAAIGVHDDRVDGGRRDGGREETMNLPLDANLVGRGAHRERVLDRPNRAGARTLERHPARRARPLERRTLECILGRFRGEQRRRKELPAADDDRYGEENECNGSQTNTSEISSGAIERELPHAGDGKTPRPR